MLTLWRRHTKACSAGRAQHDKKFLKCSCVLQAEGSLIRGVYVRESLRTRDYREAMRRIQEAEARGYWNSPSDALGPKKLAEAVAAFLEDAGNPNGRNLRPPSLAKYRSLLGKFLAYCGDVPLDTIDPDQVRKFKDTWKMGARSAAGNISKIRAAFKFFLDNEWVTRNPAMSVRIPKGAKGEDHQKQPFTAREIERIMNVADSDPDAKTLIQVMLTMGLRISDAAMLQDHHIVDGHLDVKTIKTGSRVTQPIRPEVLERINATETADGYYFAKGSRRMQTVTDYWRRRIIVIFKAAGIKNGTVHRFRHSFALNMLLKGVDIKSLSLLLGHHSVTITEKYYASFVKEREKMLSDIVRDSWNRDLAA
jgi:integrase